MATELTVLEPVSTSCCSPVTGGVLSDAEARSLAARFKAMGDPSRLRLLSLIAATESGEACVCDLNESLDLSQGTVSHHLGILVKAGLLTRTKRGQWSFYALVPGAMSTLARALDA
ncbi:putative transcriptional regulator, ArsR family protein [Aeromicrobium flavum]|uniref:Putative transcriptional regulator, ArsR family protein n=1 Tax=Aeromicrobium flavum TaxID=416568 RepID=A0A512HU84_9ACTN|nr:metalloregulator ArsR/SmtB family transcription factor [Aeromicrobium flavum]GEO89009.1 putative transcriptional regulator, ArsR family protein [Aeromicrobium flavum]